MAADALGIADRVGTLEAGKLADIVVIDGNPLADIGALRRVHTVIKDGAVLVHHGAMVWPAPSNERLD